MNTVTTANIITMIRGHIQDNLKTNGRDSHQYDSDPSFSLSQDYVSSTTIKVYQNGTLLTVTSDYTYVPTAVTGKDIKVISCYNNTDGAIVKVTNSSGTLTLGNSQSLSAENCILTYTYL